MLAKVVNFWELYWRIYFFVIDWNRLWRVWWWGKLCKSKQLRPFTNGWRCSRGFYDERLSCVAKGIFCFDPKRQCWKIAFTNDQSFLGRPIRQATQPDSLYSAATSQCQAITRRRLVSSRWVRYQFSAATNSFMHHQANIAVLKSCFIRLCWSVSRLVK